MAQLPKKILIVRLGAIGDVANALIVANAIKADSPDTEIGWVVHGLARPLVEGHPSVDRVHNWQRGGGVGELRRVIRELKGCGYELAIDLQRIAKSALLVRCSGAKRTLGFDRARSKELSWLLTGERIAPADRHAHMVEQYMGFVRHLGLNVAKPEHSLPSSTEAEARADEILRELGAPPILINLGASKPANRWVPGRFGELAIDAQRTFGVPVCLIGGPDDRAIFAEDLKRIEGSDSVTDLVGSTSLPELWALERRSRLFVGLDTGPMHLAVAVGLPCVILFGAADHRRTGPFGERDRIVRISVPCAPCNKRECPLPRHDCMEDITTQSVLQTMAEVMEKRAPTARP